MAPRRRRRSRSESPNGRRRGRPPLATNSNAATTSTSGFGSTDAQAVLSRVAQLVQENQTLIRENNELKSTLAQIAEATQVTILSAPAPTDGQSETQVPPSTPSAGNGRRRRRRGRISDPSTLERRRAALAKAREVLAAKRAAAKRGRGGS